MIKAGPQEVTQIYTMGEGGRQVDVGPDFDGRAEINGCSVLADLKPAGNGAEIIGHGVFWSHLL